MRVRTAWLILIMDSDGSGMFTIGFYIVLYYPLSKAIWFTDQSNPAIDVGEVKTNTFDEPLTIPYRDSQYCLLSMNLSVGSLLDDPIHLSPHPL